MIHQDRFIICMKYGSAYPADYVNVLYNATKKALKNPARFICLTDDANGILPEVEIFPIPETGLTGKEWYRSGVWPKVSLFDGEFHGLRGRALFIDLDMVIVNDLDAFFELEGDVIGTNANASWGLPNQDQTAPEFGSMIFSWNLGQHPEVADHFRANKEEVWAEIELEQAYVHSRLPGASFWPQGWVASFKRNLRQPVGLDLFLPPKQPDGDIKVLAFHGRPRPIDLIRGKPYFWDRFPHMGNGRVQWMADYWTANGGRMPKS